MPPCLTLSIIRYGSRVKWRNPGKGVASSLHLGVVAIKKGAFGSPSTIVDKIKAKISVYLLLFWQKYHTSSYYVFINKAPHFNYRFTNTWLSFQQFFEKSKWQTFLSIIKALKKLTLTLWVFSLNSQLWFIPY